MSILWQWSNEMADSGKSKIIWIISEYNKLLIMSWSLHSMIFNIIRYIAAIVNIFQSHYRIELSVSSTIRSWQNSNWFLEQVLNGRIYFSVLNGNVLWIQGKSSVSLTYCNHDILKMAGSSGTVVAFQSKIMIQATLEFRSILSLDSSKGRQKPIIAA